jgi:hypothetical protein
MGEACEAAEGVTFAVYEYDDDAISEKGVELARCATDASGACTVTLPWDPENGRGPYYVVEEDESTGTSGFSPIENPVTVFYTPTGGDAPYVNRINLRDVDELPDTGTGSAAERAANAWVPVLLAGALLLTVVGSLARSRTDG